MAEIIAKADAKVEAARKESSQRRHDIQAVSDRLKKLKKSMETRQRDLDEFLKSVKETLTMTFTKLMRRRNFSGALQFDEENGALRILVSKNSSDIAIGKSNRQSIENGPNTRSMSGGERSYTAVAFLIALGKAIQTPFRILDEFDVFMNPATRNTAIEQLINAAKETTTQYVFVTLLDILMINLNDGDNAKFIQKIMIQPKDDEFGNRQRS